MTTTLDRETTSRTHQPGDGLAHIALATDTGLPVTGRALCGHQLRGQRASPIGEKQLCVVCEDLAGGAWTETSA
jgi:hypothetical protein